MADPSRLPSFATLLQHFFTEHLVQHQSVSPRTVAAHRDTFRLLLLFAERHIGKSPAAKASWACSQCPVRNDWRFQGQRPVQDGAEDVGGTAADGRGIG